MRDTHISPVGESYGCLPWDASVTEVLPSNLAHCMRYRVIWYRETSRLYSTMAGLIYPHHDQQMYHKCYDFLHSWNRSTFFTKIWLKNLDKIPPTFIPYYVTNSIGYYIVICFLSFMFFAQSVVSVSCNYYLSGDDYNHIFTCLWCEAEMLSRWLWINAIYVSRTSWPMPGK